MSELGLKFVGKDPNGVAKPINVDADGHIVQEKKWINSYTRILAASEVRDTTAFIVDGGNVENVGMISLRISSSLDADVEIQFYSDTSTSGGSSTLKGIGYTGRIVIEQGTGITVVTPYDVPFLNYLRYIKLRVKASTTPTTGNLSIWLHTKG